ncbi:hypothetical protein Pint_12426 [Pistacia integerrima]|uniref:Uncharacterized protein n=1 Tax=Pistacia integerrima TaxID=434235 RepID=A0ACC0Y8L0_9ROSI|nr:hypothetical protein Pint_12426 [Pistacia integerrima]
MQLFKKTGRGQRLTQGTKPKQLVMTRLARGSISTRLF